MIVETYRGFEVYEYRGHPANMRFSATGRVQDDECYEYQATIEECRQWIDDRIADEREFWNSVPA